MLDPNNTGTTALVDASGNHISELFFQSYANVKGFLSNQGTIANKLSIQLLTTVFNVFFDKVDAISSIYVPAVMIPGTKQTLSSTLQNSLTANAVSTSSCVASIQNILAAAVGQLNSTSSETTFEEAHKDCLDGINNNEPTSFCRRCWP